MVLLGQVGPLTPLPLESVRPAAKLPVEPRSQGGRQADRGRCSQGRLGARFLRCYLRVLEERAKTRRHATWGPGAPLSAQSSSQARTASSLRSTPEAALCGDPPTSPILCGVVRR
ncbi:hypothetical protein MUG91_G145n16 [Manis pentadactyla]|nr:hypothetical protein MUG91_G145n16 [Manis pentadactyla]